MLLFMVLKIIERVGSSGWPSSFDARSLEFESSQGPGSFLNSFYGCLEVENKVMVQSYRFQHKVRGSFQAYCNVAKLPGKKLNGPSCIFVLFVMSS